MSEETKAPSGPAPNLEGNCYVRFIQVTHDRAPGYSLAACDQDVEVVFRYSSITGYWHADPSLSTFCLFGEAYTENLHIGEISPPEVARALAGVAVLDPRSSVYKRIVEGQRQQIATAALLPEQNLIRTSAELGIDDAARPQRRGPNPP